MDGKQQPPPQDQVFINFRGKELRNNFISHLEKALKDRGIKVFIDTYEDKGEDIIKLLTRIEESRIALVVFSSRYTESNWCLDELARIKERLDQGKIKVLPIFYKVDTSDVKRLKEEFGNHFRDREWEYRSEKHIIEKWKKALECVSGKIGLALDKYSSESDFIGKIVTNVLELLAKVSSTEQIAKSQVNQLCRKEETCSKQKLKTTQPRECVCLGARGSSLASPTNVSGLGNIVPSGQYSVNPSWLGFGSDLLGGNSLAPNTSFSGLGSASYIQHSCNPAWFGFSGLESPSHQAPNSTITPHGWTADSARNGPALGQGTGQRSSSTNARGNLLVSPTNQPRPYNMIQSSPGPSGFSNSYNNHTAQSGQGHVIYSSSTSINGVPVSNYRFVWYPSHGSKDENHT